MSVVVLGGWCACVTATAFAADAKAKPDTLTLANSGPGTITHLAGETMASAVVWGV